MTVIDKTFTDKSLSKSYDTYSSFSYIDMLITNF